MQQSHIRVGERRGMEGERKERRREIERERETRKEGKRKQNSTRIVLWGNVTTSSPTLSPATLPV